MEFKNPSKKIIRELYDEYAIATVVTKEENLKKRKFYTTQ